MKNIRQSNVNTHKDAWVEINLESLAQNIIEIKKGIPSDKKLGFQHRFFFQQWLASLSTIELTLFC